MNSTSTEFEARHGRARHGKAWPGEARLGKAWKPVDGLRGGSTPPSRAAVARRGRARLGVAGHGPFVASEQKGEKWQTTHSH